MAIGAQSLFLFVVVNGILMMTVRAANGAPIFVFGDSNVDVGTNNFLKRCTATANHPYHGIDYFFSKATGRFSNGKNIVDEIAIMLGNGDYAISPPPFLALLANKISFKRNLLRGANFASAGAGIFWETGQKHFHEIITLEQQIQQFATVRANFTELLGSPKADDLLQNSIYIFNVGSNDLIEYAFAHISDPAADPKQFIVNLTQAYGAHLSNMHKLGARKFAIIGIAPIGCAPAGRVVNTTGGCAELMNDGAIFFQMSLQSLLTELSSSLKDFKYSLGNMYTVTMNVIDNPRGNGFKEVKTACCGNGTTPHCVVGVSLCWNRDDFLFWDKFHPTEKACKLAALALVYGEGAEYVTPMNFSSLAMVGL